EIYSNDEFFIIMGSDMFLSLHTWKNAKSFLNNLNVITDLRNGVNLKEIEKQCEILKEYGAKSYIINHSVMDVSSTEIRERFKNNLDVSDFLDSKVLEYIKTHHLYGT
ncbi:MAG: nicotinate-nicotinamide nucleotide adenylyltransferase, partial [Ruminococcus sp.]